MIDKIAKKEAKETLDVLEKGFTTTKRIHQGYQEYEDGMKKSRNKSLFKKYKIKQHFGKWQYIFKKGNMSISLIRTISSIQLRETKPKKMRKWYWEIYADDDERLFTDIKRFPTKKDAMKEIENLLGD